MLLDKLSFVVSDYSVRTAPIQVAQHVTNLLLFRLQFAPITFTALRWTEILIGTTVYSAEPLGWMDGQVKVDNGYELLSTYLNRIFEDQERLKQQYDKVSAV